MFSAGGISLAIKVDIIAVFFEVGINCLNFITGAIVQCGFNPRRESGVRRGLKPPSHSGSPLKRTDDKDLEAY